MPQFKHALQTTLMDVQVEVVGSQETFRLRQNKVGPFYSIGDATAARETIAMLAELLNRLEAYQAISGDKFQATPAYFQNRI